MPDPQQGYAVFDPSTNGQRHLSERARRRVIEGGRRGGKIWMISRWHPDYAALTVRWFMAMSAHTR